VLITAAFAVLIVGGSAVVASSDGPPFSSPDESSRWLTATRLADSRSIWRDDALTRLDDRDLVHFRFELNHEGRVTTKYPILDPILSGAVVSVLGRDAAVYALALVAVAGFIGLAVGTRAIGGAPLLVLWVVPLIWNAAHVYAGMTWFVAFEGIAFALYARALRDRSLGWFAAAALVASVGLLNRYQDAPVIGLLAFALAWQFARGDAGRPRPLATVLALLAGSLAAGFVVPQLLLNLAMFGDPFTFGELLFSEGEGGATPRLVRAVLPWIPSIEVIGATSLFLVLSLAPGSVALAALYCWYARGRQVPVPVRGAAVLLLVALAYAVVSRANADGFLAVPSRPTFAAINARYWYPVYLVLTIAGAVAVSRLLPNLRLRTALLAAGALIGLGATWYLPGGDGLVNQRNTVSEAAAIRDLVATSTEPDAIIYAGLADKWLVDLRRAATWTESTASTSFDASEVAASVVTVREAGYPVYGLLWPGHGEEQQAALEGALAAEGLSLTSLGGTDAGELFAIVGTP
jgi:hypothetical protein